ncbi:acyltransferase family protein [Acuticoccus sp.]|uniref:acyltransferase family protein n=1 Tax=Acuticoccus sp. TaxID=1904378 RepID=UPI003B515999
MTPTATRSGGQAHGEIAGARPAGFSVGLESLRGIAASLVVLYHAMLVFQVGLHGEPHRTPMDVSDPALFALHALMAVFNGPNAVILFFVLSGTVLTLSLDRAGAVSGRGLVGYYVRRLFRIMPLLAFVALLAVVAHLMIAAREPLSTGTDWMQAYYRHEPGLGELVLNAIGWSNSLNSPTWTIRIEILASLVFPLLYVLRGSPAIVAAMLVALSALAFANLEPVRFHVFLISFYLGALIPLVAPRVEALMERVGPFAVVTVVVAAIGFAAAAERLYRPWVHVEPARVLLISGAAAVLVCAVYCGIGKRLLNTRVFAFLGKVSYSVYLIHFGVLFAVAYAVAPYLPQELDPFSAVAANVALGIVCLPITVAMSALSHRLVEKPFQNVGRTVSRKLIGGLRT